MLVKCPNCKGARKLMSIGGMYKACPHCQGAGQIEIEEKKEIRGEKASFIIKDELVEPLKTEIQDIQDIKDFEKHKKETDDKKRNADTKGKKGTK